MCQDYKEIKLIHQTLINVLNLFTQKLHHIYSSPCSPWPSE